MLLASFDKTPSSFLDYYLDWTPWLAGDTIANSVWVATGTVTLSDPDVIGTVTQVWVDGGAAGELIDLTNFIVTTEGREEEQTLRLKVRN